MTPKIIQRDRDAAADLFLKLEGEPYSPFDLACAQSIRDGNNDHWDIVQAFARHRQEIEREVVERCAQIAHGMRRYNDTLADEIAAVIREDGHAESQP